MKIQNQKEKFNNYIEKKLITILDYSYNYDNEKYYFYKIKGLDKIYITGISMDFDFGFYYNTKNHCLSKDYLLSDDENKFILKGLLKINQK